MYNDHFQFREAPFSITPDPAFVYMSPRHREALGHLLYGTGRHGGFVQLTGEVGTGKTTIVRTLLAQELEQVDVAVILNPRQSESEFVASICDELHVPAPAEPSLKTCIDALNQHLLETHAAGRRTVLIIDEAQNLSPDVLEQVRLLTNLETHKEKLLRIMLVGQPELSDLLARPDLRQVSQRITARFHLTPLSAAETGDYIRHRLRVAGGDTALFTPAAVQQIHRLSGGVPRLINVICDRALLGTYAEGTRSVTPAFVKAAAREALGSEPDKHEARRHPWHLIAGAAGLLMLGISAGLLLRPAAPAGSAAPTTAQGPASAAEAAPGTRMAAAPTARPDPSEPLQPGPSTPSPTAPPATDAPRVATAEPVQPVSVPASTEAPVPATPEPLPEALPAASSADRADLPTSTEQPLSALMNRLLQHWEFQVEVRAGERVCTAISRAGLACYRGRADWNILEALNRPAILTTMDADGQTRYRLLLALEADQAILATAQGRERVAISSLDSSWIGEFLLLWRPETDRSLIGPASSGASVQWLRRKLARINDQPEPDPAGAEFDDALRAAVTRFQRSRGLDADGLVGTRTLIALNNADPLHEAPALIRRQR